MPWGWHIAAVLTPWFLLSPSSLRHPSGLLCSFPLQDSFLPSVVPIAEIAPEVYVVWVQQHRNRSFSQILLERYPALGQRKWGGPPSGSLAVLPTLICGEEFGVWGTDPWQIPHYSVTSETRSFYPDCLSKRFPLSDLISPHNPFACVVLSLGLFPLHYPQSKVCLWGGLRGCISSPGCSLLWRNPLPLPLLPPPLGVLLPTLCTHLLRCLPRVLPSVQGLQEAFPKALRRSAWPHCPL